MKKNLFFLGMDIAQDSAAAQLIDADARVLWRGQLTARIDSWQELQKRLKALLITFSELFVVMEASGLYHLPWAERFTHAGAHVFVLNPLLSARVQSFHNAIRENKTDPLDAEKCAQMGREHLDELERFGYRSAPAKQGFKELLSARAAVRHALTNLRKSYRSHLELVFPALLHAGLDPYSQKAARVLARASTAQAWLDLPSDEQLGLLDSEKALALTQACRASLADEALARASAPAVAQLIATQQELDDRLTQLDALIAEQASAQPRMTLLCSLPGIGAKTGAVLAAYLPAEFTGWGSRAHIVAKLQALFGCDPRRRQSGKWNGQVKISKRGISAARTALWQSSFCSLKLDADMRAYYDSLRALGKAHKPAMIDLMRKQLRRLVAVLDSNQPFIPMNRLTST
jgi:transposase